MISEKGQQYTFGDGRHGKLGLGQESFSNQFVPQRVKRFSKFSVEKVLLFLIVFTQSIGTHYVLTILVLKFEVVHSTTSSYVQNIAVCMANSGDPDQMPHSAAYDLGPHCLQRPVCSST